MFFSDLAVTLMLLFVQHSVPWHTKHVLFVYLQTSNVNWLTYEGHHRRGNMRLFPKNPRVLIFEGFFVPRRGFSQP